MTCRDEILTAISQVINEKGKNEFSMPEIVIEVKKNGTQYQESTIRTHISSRMCTNSPNNHGTTYNDIERIRKGIYRLL